MTKEEKELWEDIAEWFRAFCLIASTSDGNWEGEPK